LILEQLARNRVFLGEEGLKKVRNSFVIIVGCGGVGSWAATMLLRSGVGKIRLVDFDQVTLSSLNRHAVATLSDVGTPKVQALRKRMEQVAPWVEIDARNDLWRIEHGDVLLAGEPTFVVDAIDNLDTKVDLLYYCKSRGIPIISSMGAGCKSDPTRVYPH
jgi:tRNA A37 threonylcarbamoyladenosine dehydratase